MVLSGPSVFVLLWFNLCTHDCGGFAGRSWTKFQCSSFLFFEEKKSVIYKWRNFLTCFLWSDCGCQSCDFQLYMSHRPSGSVLKEVCVLCVSRGAMTRRLTLTRWVWRLATHCYSSTQVAHARVHIEVLRGCLRAHLTRLVVSVVCLKIVIKQWLYCMRRSDPSVSHKRLHKHRPEPDTHSLLYSCLCEAFTLTSIHFPFFCTAKPLTTVHLTQTSTLPQFRPCL